MQFIFPKKIKIKDRFLEQLQSFLASKEIYVKQNSAANEITFELNDVIRGKEQYIKLLLKIEKDEIINVIAKIPDDNLDNLNEYDLEHYVDSLLLEVLLLSQQDKLKKYVIRNYCYYLNSYPMELDMVFHGQYKFRLHSASIPPNQEPLNENVLMIDTEIEAVNLEHAMSLSYNHSKDICALLSVLLDVGFEPLMSERRAFIIKDENKLINQRYRTGFIDTELGLVVKDNLNGIKAIKDSEDFNRFWSGVVSSMFTFRTKDFVNSNMYVQHITEKKELENVFLTLKIGKNNNNNTVLSDNINDDIHYPNNRINVPRCIRSYFKNIYDRNLLPTDKYEAYISFARLFNLSLYTARYEPTMSASYKISAIEALAKCESLSFSDFMKKYCEGEIDKKLLDYYYGNIRSGHFHSGKFAFNEYQTSLLSEIDLDLHRLISENFKFCRMIRSAYLNWLKNNKIIA